MANSQTDADDATLFRMLKMGPEKANDALLTLMARHQPAVKSAVSGEKCSAWLAEEVCLDVWGDVFIVAVERTAAGEAAVNPATRFGAWVYGMTRRLVRTKRAEICQALSNGLDDEEGYRHESRSTSAELELLRACLRKELSDTPSLRYIITMLDCDLVEKEAASSLGIKRQTLRLRFRQQRPYLALLFYEHKGT